MGAQPFFQLIEGIIFQDVVELTGRSVFNSKEIVIQNFYEVLEMINVLLSVNKLLCFFVKVDYLMYILVDKMLKDLS